MTTRCDVVVIGAGIAGAAAAIMLAESGWNVSIVEKSAFPRRKVCGECISAPALGLIGRLGIGEKFSALAGPELERVGLYAGNERFQAALPRFADSAEPWGRALGREHLDSLLLARAAQLGAKIWQPCVVERVIRDRDLHVCELTRDRRESFVLEAPIVVCAHGSWERPPRAAAERAMPADSDLLAFKANFINAGLAPGQLPVLALPGGYGGMVVTDHGRLTVACCIRRGRLRAWRAAMPGASAGEAVQDLLTQSCAGVREALDGAERTGPWLAVGPIQPGIRPAWSAQHGFAVGNAAGEAHPILGEGISMALQSSCLLCAHLIDERDRLLAGASQQAVAERYARDWRTLFAARARWAALFAQLVMQPAGVGALLPMLRHWPSLLTHAARLGGKARGPRRLAAKTLHGRQLMRDLAGVM